MTTLNWVLGLATALSTVAAAVMGFLGARGKTRSDGQAGFVDNLQEEVETHKKDAREARVESERLRQKDAARDEALGKVYEQLAEVRREMADLQHGVWTLVSQLRREGMQPEWEPVVAPPPFHGS